MSAEAIQSIAAGLIISVVACCVMTGCSSEGSCVDFKAPKASLTGCHTYGWLAASDAELKDDRLSAAHLDPIVRRAVNEALAENGYVQQTPGCAPDFVVAYHVVLEDLTSEEINVYCPYSVSETADVAYEQGELVLDVASSRGNSLIFRAAAPADLHEDASPAEYAEDIAEAVEGILAEVPSRIARAGEQIPIPFGDSSNAIR